MKLLLFAIFLILIITKFDLGFFQTGIVIVAFVVAIVGIFLPDKKLP